MPSKRRRYRASLQIPEYELLDLYEAYDVFGLVQRGKLLEEQSSRVDPSYRCSLGGESFYTRIRRHDGTQVGRVHYLRCVFGHLIGRYPSTIIIDEVLLHRQRHQRRPSG